MATRRCTSRTRVPRSRRRCTAAGTHTAQRLPGDRHQRRCRRSSTWYPCIVSTRSTRGRLRRSRESIGIGTRQVCSCKWRPHGSCVCLRGTHCCLHTAATPGSSRIPRSRHRCSCLVCWCTLRSSRTGCCRTHTRSCDDAHMVSRFDRSLLTQHQRLVLTGRSNRSCLECSRMNTHSHRACLGCTR